MLSHVSQTASQQLSRRLVAGFAVLILVVVGVGVVTAFARQGDSNGRTKAGPLPSMPAPGASRSPESPSAAPSGPTGVAAADTAANGYYTALAHGDARTAYGLLCTRQQVGYGKYAEEVARNAQTGTSITSFRRAGVGQVRGLEAGVPGRVVLANGEATPIVVLLVVESGRWRVCSSDLGGVLPAPGSTTGASPSPSVGASI